MIERAKVVVDPSVRDLCRKPYPGHPRGCPNYGKRGNCPPQALLLNEVVDLSKTIWVVWVEFNLEWQRNRMRWKHPKWSIRQAECCLYWQAGVRAELCREIIREQIALARATGIKASKLIGIEVPEAMGVNVTETMKSIGVELQWPPDKIVRKVGLIGYARAR